MTDATLAERLVARTSSILGARQTRRRFLARTAVVGSALAVNPWGYILRPGTAYGALCGTCGDGWTAFCCTVNGGRNSCPPGSFVGGWWKADNAAFCCGAARYIIDCNASCPTSCRCRCSGASCDGRRTCCNQFRYGQCHQEIACYGPVVCRVATCTPPWQYDRSCTTTSATDNRTVTHGAPCLPDPCASAIAKLYDRLGGAGGVLGPVVTPELATSDRSGRYAHYRNGSIFQRTGGAAHEVHGAVATRYKAIGYHRSPLGYPTSDQGAVGDSAKGVYNRFELGVIYSAAASGTWETYGAVRALHSRTGGVRGPLGYPRSTSIATPDGAGQSQKFGGGHIWFSFVTGAHWTGGAIDSRYSAVGSTRSVLGYPTADHTRTAGGALTRFQHGSMYDKAGAGTHLLHGPIHGKFRGGIGEVGGLLGWPTSDIATLGPGFAATFERGAIYYRPDVAVAEVHGGILDKLTEVGGPLGALGFPTSDVTTLPDGRGRVSRFQRGAIYYQPGVGTWELHGPIQTRYVARGEASGSLGYPRSDVVTEGSVQHADFEHGRLAYDPGTGQVT